MRKIDIEAERQFENMKTTSGNVREDQSKFYWATRLEINEHLLTTCSTIKNKSVLEIGCSSGEDAKSYAQYACHYIGVDISDEAINKALQRDLPNCEFLCADGHVLPVDDATIDCVIVNSLLHHLDLKLTFSEIARVLKPNGKLIYREPLGTNPLFNLYRVLTPGARTKDEAPFSFSDLKLLRCNFATEPRYFGFLSLISAYLKWEFLRIILTNCDRWIAKTPLRYLFWQIAGVGTSKKTSEKHVS